LGPPKALKPTDRVYQGLVLTLAVRGHGRAAPMGHPGRTSSASTVSMMSPR
jgi:hypothetical protein